jgi:molybdopterin-containing oxidoreductase family membrane subunit
MWFERFVIVIPSLSHEFEPWQWGSYAPTWVDYSILLGSFGWFFMWFLLFVRQMPVMAISEVKEIIPPKMRHPVDRSHDLDALVIDPDQTLGDD